MERVPIASLKGPKGEDGEQGLPGVNAVENDTAVGGYVGTGSSATRAAINAALGAEISTPDSPARTAGDAVWAAHDEITDMVTSTDARTIIASTDPAEVASAPDGTLALLYGRAGAGTDFYAGVGELIPIFTEGAWFASDNTYVRTPSVGASSWRGAVVSAFSGTYRDVEIVVRTMYTDAGAGLNCLPFVRARDIAGEVNALYAGIQSAAIDGSVSAGLRMNAVVGGASGAITTGATAKNGAVRNVAGTFYYIRLRAIGNSVMSKQWVATEPEPAVWDLVLSDAELPARFKTGANRTGLAGFMSRGTSPQLYDWFSIAFDGATAPLKED